MVETAKNDNKRNRIPEAHSFYNYLNRFLAFNKEIEFKIAKNDIEKEGAYLLRWRVFAKELGQIRNYSEIVDKWDHDEFSTLFVAKDKRISNELESIVTTVRVTKNNNTIAQKNGYKLGLPLEDFYDLSLIYEKSISIGQSNWFCTKKEYRRKFTDILLIRKIFQYSYETNIDCGVIFSSLHTNNYYKAMEIYKKGEKRGLLYPELNLKPIVQNDIVGDKLSEEELKRVKIPGLVKLYTSIGFKICGKPLYNSKFSTYDIPMFMRYYDAPKFFLKW